MCKTLYLGMNHYFFNGRGYPILQDADIFSDRLSVQISFFNRLSVQTTFFCKLFYFAKLSYNSLHILLFDKIVNEHTVSALFN